MASNAPTEQPRVLVVEDEFLIALDLSETLRDCGYTVEGPYANWEHALIAIDQHMPDFALLDIMTGSGEVYPLADVLEEAGVPIIFHSGHVPPKEVAERYPDAQACSKPCPPGDLIRMFTAAMEQRSETRH